MLAQLPGLDLPDAGLVVFPEVFQRDFGSPGSDLSSYAEPLDGPFVTALTEVAGDRTLVAGMLEVSPDPKRPYNTLVAVNADGVVASYRKIHLYDSFGYRESEVTMPGDVDARAVFEVGSRGDGSEPVRVGLMTCYDLRFPELARRLAADVDLLLVPAAWVAGPHKVRHWRTLLTARAIENIAYVAGVGQPAPRYSGNSLVVDPWGSVLADAGLDKAVVTAQVDPHTVARAREENPSLANRRISG